MSRYRNSEEPYRVPSQYRGQDRYLVRRSYGKPYNNPKPARKYSQRSTAQGARGKHDRYPKPNYFQSPKPEKKYEAAQNSEKATSPFTSRTPRYTVENLGIEKRVDTEDVAAEVKKRLDSKLTERILEKFGTELEELLRKFESSEKVKEQELEPKQELEAIETNAGARGQDDCEQKKDSETVKIESDGGAPELTQESKEDVSLDGSFEFSKTFGLAIPVETSEEKEIEDVEAESQEESNVEKETADESRETENADGKTEIESLDDLEAEEESGEEIVEQSEEAVENKEDIEVEDSHEHAETSEVAEEVIEPEETTELLPEEAELYSVEVELM